MTNPARIAAYKSKTLALSDQLKLEPVEIVALGITQAVAHMASAGLRPDDLRATLEHYLAEAEKAEVANDR